MRVFYRDFAAAYGTCWLLSIGVSLVLQAHVETGIVGGLGFPLVSLAYAIRCRRRYERA